MRLIGLAFTLTLSLLAPVATCLDLWRQIMIQVAAPRARRREISLPRRSEAGLALYEVILAIAVIAFLAVAAYFFWRSLQSPATVANPSGQASFTTPALPQSRFDVRCQSSGQPTVTQQSNPTNVTRLAVSFKAMAAIPCQGSGQTCQSQVWEIVANQDWFQDLDPQKTNQHTTSNLGTLVCPCTCSAVAPTPGAGSAPGVKILNLQWQDLDRRPYPNGERATYYNVRFRLTDPATTNELDAWTEWVRVPGGHTHYGYRGFKQITVDIGQCPVGPKLIACARQQSGHEVATPPNS